MDAELAAIAARDKLGLGPVAPIADLVGAVELAGPDVYVLDMGHDGVAGAFHTERDRSFLFVNGGASHPLVRRRFTLAHEFGHFSLGHGDQLDEKIQFDDNAPAVEVEANKFAAEFLVPKAAIDAWAKERPSNPYSFDHLTELACSYGVSALMMCFRFANLGRVDFATKNSYCSLITDQNKHISLRDDNRWETFGSTTDQARLVPRVPSALDEAVTNLVERDKLTLERATDLLEGAEAAALDKFKNRGEASSLDDA